MADELSLKDRFKDYGLDRGYFIMLAQKFNIPISDQFNYFIVDTTHPYTRGESLFFDIILTNNGHYKPDLVIKAKEYIAPRIDVFDRKRQKTINPLEQDFFFHTYFGKIQVYDFIPNPGILLMEKCNDPEGHESLEQKLLDLYNLYGGADEAQRRSIREEIKEYLLASVKVAREHSKKATEKFFEEASIRPRLDGGTEATELIFYDKNGNRRLNKFRKKDYIDRLKEYLDSIHFLKYHQVRKLLDHTGKIILEHAESNRYSKRARDWWLDMLGEGIQEEFKQIASFLSESGPKREVIHFDLRSSNILLKSDQIEFCDYEKTTLGHRSIDPATIMQDVLINSFDISLEEKIEILSGFGLDSDEISNSNIWVLLRATGAQSLMQCYHLDKYQRLLQKSRLYDNKRVLVSNLKTLEEILNRFGKYPILLKNIKLINEGLEARYGRRSSPDETQRIIEKNSHRKENSHRKVNPDRVAV